MMKLNSYTFTYEPDRWTPPRAAKSSSFVQTYSSAAFFSWGLSLVGEKILLEWDRLDLAQFDALDDILALDTVVVWEPCIGRLTHGAVTNGPFVEDKTIRGDTSTATATINLVHSATTIDVITVDGTFQAEVIRDNSSPVKSATVSTISVPKYNVELVSLDGKLVEPWGSLWAYRQDIILTMVVMGVI
jgi:hypothetical protein